MKKEEQEQDVIRLLERLKAQGSTYPIGPQQKRREAFLALGVSILPHGAGISDLAGQAAAQSTHAAGLPMTLGMKLTLGFLSTAIVGLSTYLGITVYENRDALRDYFEAGAPTATLVSPPPDGANASSATPTYLSTVATPTPTPIFTPTLPYPGPENSYPAATPTIPGLHLGQTKTPKPKPFK